ncbi:MAG: hypothetical protein FJ027_14335 [Candidatus Rokubacteria bacterium]|nr:hypothetical protein [Candidatus Rokubacteria bacterium]
MIVFEPSHASAGGWQLPWLRVSLILRTMAGDAACRDDELAALLAMRRELAQAGWFN